MERPRTQKNSTFVRHYSTTSPKQQTVQTIKLIGNAIQKCTGYFPIRQHAAMVATRARPKDYIGQVQAIYDDIVKRWRYVRDPVGVETLATSPEAVHKFVMGTKGGLGEGLGGEDCDGVTVAIGALLQNIGFPVRIATTSPIISPPGGWFTHVFIQTLVPSLGWVTVDPVLYPRETKIGATTPHSAIMYWGLNGEKLGHKGPIPNLGGNMLGNSMSGAQQQIWNDYGLAGTDEDIPDDWREGMVLGFGGCVETMGYTDGEGLGIHVEADPIEVDGQVFARTPMLELAASDYEYLQRTGNPYIGMLALGDTGEIYEYDPNFGGFKKWWRKLKRKAKRFGRKVKKGFRKVGRKIKKFIRKLPGGKYLIRLGKKLMKVGMKLVKPLMKYVGKYAKYLAPVAAFIPGAGPAVAAALAKAGKVQGLLKKFKVKFKRGPRGTKQLKFVSSRHAKAFKKELRRAAITEARKRRPPRRGGPRPRGKVVRSGSPQHLALVKRLIRASGYRVI